MQGTHVLESVAPRVIYGDQIRMAADSCIIVPSNCNPHTHTNLLVQRVELVFKQGSHGAYQRGC
jgi:hypothetical protein